MNNTNGIKPPTSAAEIMQTLNLLCAHISELHADVSELKTLANQPQAGGEAPHVAWFNYQTDDGGWVIHRTVRANTIAELEHLLAEALTLAEQIGRPYESYNNALLPKPKAETPPPPPPPPVKPPPPPPVKPQPRQPQPQPRQPQPPPRPQTGKGPPICPQCGSPCWDNRNDPNATPASPLLKCKNRECDYRLWRGKKR